MKQKNMAFDDRGKVPFLLKFSRRSKAEQDKREKNNKKRHARKTHTN